MTQVALVALSLVAAAALAGVLLLYLRKIRHRAPAGARTTAVATAHAPEPSRPPPLALVCPSCRREYPVGLRFCPHDARPLAPSGEAVRSVGSGVICPSCKRSFEGTTRFCPYDAEEVVPIGMAAAAARHGHPRGGAFGKICPSCAQRYEAEATFCGRDGSELVSVN